VAIRLETGYGRNDLHRTFDLTDRIAVVTGGGSGLGRVFCEALAEFGAEVVCADLREDWAMETVTRVRQNGGRALPMRVDVADYSLVKSMFDQVQNRYGRLDVLVNNAGIVSVPASIHEVDVANWRHVLDVNLDGSFYCMKEALRLMLPHGKGSIINISSVAGTRGNDVFPAVAYVSSKAAVIGLTKQGAAEYGDRGIRVNAIAPGWFLDTNLSSDAGLPRLEEDSDIGRLLASRTTMKRTGKSVELGGLVVYLASDASSYVTGQVIGSDGGWTAI
jgi:NAD(P)-dependent dehydrogenase (short-subunit alcohol dehydrogenase family)